MPKARKNAQRITFEEAKKLFPNEWVVFSDARIDLKAGAFIDGLVYWHGLDQQEAYRKAGEVKGDTANFYTGSIPYKRVTLTEDHENRKRVA
jgi:hypothetical protein